MSTLCFGENAKGVYDGTELVLLSSRADAGAVRAIHTVVLGTAGAQGRIRGHSSGRSRCEDLPAEQA